MEKKSVAERILLASFMFICIAFITGMAGIFIVLMGGIYYIGLILAIAIFLFLLFVLNLFEFFRTNKRKVVFFIIAFLGIGLTSIFPIYEAYKNQLETVDSEVNIYEYMPFAENRKIAALHETATLELNDNLPKIDGATALYPLYSAIVQAIYPEKEYDLYNSEVMVNTTPTAYTKLIDGEVDMIFAAAPSISQENRAGQRGLELKLTPIGKEAFVFFVNNKNTVDGLSREQLKGIYSGKITNWEEVGGKNDAIRAFQRPEDSGSQSALQSFMGKTPIMAAPTEDIASGMGGIINEVAQYKNFKNAIGYTFRFYSTQMVQNNKIKLLEIDGIAPTKENIRNNSYPITSEFYIVTAGTQNPNVEKLIDWILSPQGQQLIEKAGYIPINE
ncbi:substrate-binding domain-containing protein [Lysinibacillus fusiformis]|nr:substrate-binding domain-containing protein [Lysinibacillus fusiformis]